MAEQYIRELSEIKSNDGTVREWSKEKKEEQSRRLSVRSMADGFPGMHELNLFPSMLLCVNPGAVTGSANVRKDLAPSYCYHSWLRCL